MKQVPYDLAADDIINDDGMTYLQMFDGSNMFAVKRLCQSALSIFSCVDCAYHEWYSEVEVTIHYFCVW